MAVPTIAYYIDHNHDVEAVCRRCQSGGYLDLHALAERYGRDLDMDRLRAMLKCKDCGARGMARTIIRIPEPKPGETAARNLWMAEQAQQARDRNKKG